MGELGVGAGLPGVSGVCVGEGEGVGLAEFEGGVSVGSGVGVGSVALLSRKSAPDTASATTTAVTERITPIVMA